MQEIAIRLDSAYREWKEEEALRPAGLMSVMLWEKYLQVRAEAAWALRKQSKENAALIRNA